MIKFFGETNRRMENLIAQGETAQSINQKGDLVAGEKVNILLKLAA